jgi:uncharacterized OB-fold protein
MKAAVEYLNTQKESSLYRISRAFHWYRRAIHTTEPLDRYTSLWVGIETLNPLLKKHYHLPDDKQKCQKCGHETVPTLNGVQTLFEELSPETSVWPKANRLRVGIVHGFDSFAELIPDANDLIPFLEDALVKGLDRVLGLKDRGKTYPVPLDYSILTYVELRTEINGPDMSEVDTRIEPEFGLLFEEPKITTGEVGPERQEVPIVMGVHKLEEGFEFTTPNIRVHATSHIGGKKLEVKFT